MTPIRIWHEAVIASIGARGPRDDRERAWLVTAHGHRRETARRAREIAARRASTMRSLIDSGDEATARFARAVVRWRMLRGWSESRALDARYEARRNDVPEATWHRWILAAARWARAHGPITRWLDAAAYSAENYMRAHAERPPFRARSVAEQKARARAWVRGMLEAAE